MTREEAIQKYKDLGLVVEEGCDDPGYMYHPHKHETTYLYTVHGSIKLKKGDGDWKIYERGDECVVADGEQHQAIVGTEGWTYVAGWSEEESKKYKDVIH